MLCRQISFSDFRCLENKILTLDPDINIISGANGTGKTSMLEGIYIFARGKSFRTQHDDELIRFDREYAVIDMNFESELRRESLNARMIYGTGGRKNLFFNGIKITKMSEFIGNFRAVLFCPKHLSLVQSGPSGRRLFLDSAISQIETDHIRSLQKYAAVMSQRNAVLKDLRDGRYTDPAMLEILSDQLAEISEKVSANRADYTVLLLEKASILLSDMTNGKEKLEAVYKWRKSRDEYLRELTESTDREIKYAATLFGAHREDLDISLNGRDARSFASQGQQRSIALAMKLAEGEISKDKTGEYPVFLFDDLLSELDEKRRKYLISGLKGRQVVITTADETALSK